MSSTSSSSSSSASSSFGDDIDMQSSVDDRVSAAGVDGRTPETVVESDSASQPGESVDGEDRVSIDWASLLHQGYIEMPLEVDSGAADFSADSLEVSIGSAEFLDDSLAENFDESDFQLLSDVESSFGSGFASPPAATTGADRDVDPGVAESTAVIRDVVESTRRDFSALLAVDESTPDSDGATPADRDSGERPSKRLRLDDDATIGDDLSAELAKQRRFIVDVDEARSTLLCQVCRGMLAAPIMMCKTGHSICKTCRDELHECPVCKKSFLFNVRNFTLEAFLDNVYYSCENLNCGYDATTKDKDQHAQDCTHREFTCELCSWRGPLPAYVAHVASAQPPLRRHRADSCVQVTADGECTLRIDINELYDILARDRAFRFVQFDGQLFGVAVVRGDDDDNDEGDDDLMHICVRMFGRTDQASQYVCQLKLGSSDPSLRNYQVVYSVPVHSDTVTTGHIGCVMIGSTRMLRKQGVVIEKDSIPATTASPSSDEPTSAAAPVSTPDDSGAIVRPSIPVVAFVDALATPSTAGDPSTASTVATTSSAPMTTADASTTTTGAPAVGTITDNPLLSTLLADWLANAFNLPLHPNAAATPEPSAAGHSVHFQLPNYSNFTEENDAAGDDDDDSDSDEEDEASSEYLVLKCVFVKIDD